MSSQINPNIPVQGNPTTASVRANFATAQQEISALQVNTTGAPFLPLGGGKMAGAITLYNDPTAPMHPVTLGYLQVHGGGGGGSGGIPEAPADGTLYARQDAAWLHAVNTAELNAAVNGAPYLKLSGGTLTGPLILSGPPTVALNPASKAYTDSNFLGLAGGTLTGPLILQADPTQALGAATKQSIDNQHFIPQIGTSASQTLAVVDNTTGADKTPTLTGYLNPYNGASAVFKIQARRLPAPVTVGSTTVWGDGAAIAVGGPSAISNANGVTLFAGNNTAGYKAWIFGPDGSLLGPQGATTQLHNNVLTVGTNPSFTCWDQSQNYAAGMFLGGSSTLYFAAMDGSGNSGRLLMSAASDGSLGLGLGQAVNDPLNISVAQGNYARINYTVANARTWLSGCNTDGSFVITDVITGIAMLQLTPGGFIQPHVRIRFAAGDGISYASVAYGSSNAIAFGWATIGGYPGNVAVSVDNGAAVMPLASAASDVRLKSDIAPSSHDCLATVLQLPLHEYRWRTIPDPNNLRAARVLDNAPRKRVGMIAQEIAKVFPEGVMEGDTFDRRLGLVWSLDTNNLLALAFGSIQQLTARIASLEAATATRY